MSARLVLAALLGAAASAAAVGLAATSAWLVVRAAEQPPVLHLMVAIVAVRTFGVARGLLRYLERLVSHDAAFRLLAALRVRVYQRLERLAPAGLGRLRSGDLLSRLVADVDALQDRWLRVRLPYAAAGLVGVGSVGLVGALLPASAVALALSLLAAALLAPWATAAVARRGEQRLAPLRGELSAAAVELLQGADDLVALGATPAHLARIDDIDARLARAEARSAGGAGLGTLVAGLSGGLAVWAALTLGVPAVRSGALAGTALAVVVLTPLAVHEVFAGLGPAAQARLRVRAAAGRVADVLDRPDPVDEPTVPCALPAGPYGLRVEGLRARWDALGADALQGVDVDLPAGGRVAVVGPSGAGKSTLAAVLLRFLDPSGGRALLVGSDREVEMTALDGDALRRVVGLCAQDTHVFDTTVEENLRLARRDATPAQLRTALEAARLAEWVDALPLGLATPLGEHGARMSGGQRQRLALARVLLADFPVVVLDEPTEHLDEATAAELTADLLAATAGRTVLLVTHRLDLVPDGAVDAVVRIGAEPVADTVG